MTLTRRDANATLLTALALVVFFASHEGWGAPLVGGSARWASGAMLVIGLGACAQGDPTGRANPLLVGLGFAALGLELATIATGSLTLLSLVAADMVALWALSTLEHAGHLPSHRAGPATG